MASDPIVNQAIASYDQYRTIFRRSLRIIGKSETLPNWIGELVKTIADVETDPADKLEANAMLVGILTVMLEDIQEGKTNA